MQPYQTQRNHQIQNPRRHRIHTRMLRQQQRRTKTSLTITTQRIQRRPIQHQVHPTTRHHQLCQQTKPNQLSFQQMFPQIPTIPQPLTKQGTILNRNTLQLSKHHLRRQHPSQNQNIRLRHILKPRTSQRNQTFQLTPTRPKPSRPTRQRPRPL